MFRTIAVMIVSACCMTDVNAHQPAFRQLRRKIKREREAAEKIREAEQARRAEPKSALKVTTMKLADGADLYVFPLA